MSSFSVLQWNMAQCVTGVDGPGGLITPAIYICTVKFQNSDGGSGAVGNAVPVNVSLQCTALKILIATSNRKGYHTIK